MSKKLGDAPTLEAKFREEEEELVKETGQSESKDNPDTTDTPQHEAVASAPECEVKKRRMASGAGLPDGAKAEIEVPVFESDDVDNISITAVTGHADIANVLRAAGKNALATAMKKVVESLLP
eukprot:GEMP01078736.1.p2 GENE.GEMP01078736.1~~GEMP01078736.1.p2  ORF type:complete len:123 (+),score=34.42 GEMP01078736.1:233-601(+)